MKTYFTLLWAGLCALPLLAQFDQPAVGASYANGTFYRLSDGATTSHAHTEWDLAFAVAPQDAGVFFNEGVASMATGLELYLTAAADFGTVDTAGMVQVYNPEISWSEGAFNAVKDPENAFDFGWGGYDLNTHEVNGNRVFVIKMRTGDYKKLEVQQLAGGTYTFRYANLDGSEEVTETITKADYAGKTLAYYSMATGGTVDLEPDNWDLLFTRYYTPLDAGGTSLEYVVTGVLTNAGVEVAQAEGVDPVNVSYQDYAGSYSDTLTTIGHDWKDINLQTFQWEIVYDRVYFVKTPENELWRVQFLDFEGSSTGITTLEKTFETTITSTTETIPGLNSVALFPNPVDDQLNVAIEWDLPRFETTARITNAQGRLLEVFRLPIDQGLNVKTITADQWPAGTYFLQIDLGANVLTRPFIKK